MDILIASSNTKRSPDSFSARRKRAACNQKYKNKIQQRRKKPRLPCQKKNHITMING